MSNDDATNHRKLFGYHLPNELVSQILEKLDPKTLVTSRMVNSQWQMAVDNLSYLWSGLTRRLGIADACESGRERCRAQKMLGDCWITSSFCPVGIESETLESDLKPSSVRLNSTGQELTVTAFDPRSLTCQRWELQLMPRSMTFSMVYTRRKVNVQGESNWVTILIEDRNTREWRRDIIASSPGSDDSDNESEDGNDIDSSGVAHDTIRVADNAVSNDNNAPINTDNAEDGILTINRPRGHFADQATDANNPLAVTLPDTETTRNSMSMFALLPLRRTPTNSVFPLARIEIPSDEPVIAIAAQPCKRHSCSEIQVLVLTDYRLLLYALAPPTESTEESTTSPPILSSPHASIVFAQTIPTNPQEVLYMSIVTLDSDLSSNNPCMHCVVCIRQKLDSDFHHSLTLVRIDCRQLQHLSSVRLPDEYFITSFSEQTLLLVMNLDPDMHDMNSDRMRLVRYSVSAQNCLHLDYDPCEYHYPPWRDVAEHPEHFATGQRFWYCMGYSESSLLPLALAIYLIGCPEPLLLVNLEDLILQSRNPLHKDPYVSCIASTTWIDFGFEPDSPDQTPLLAIGWGDEINLLIGWCCGPPKWPLSSRCQPAQISGNFQLDWPWLQLRRTAARQIGSPSSGFD